MTYEAKPKEQLVHEREIIELRHRIAELEALETERSRGEEALRATKEYAENLINSSLDMIISVDLDRHITEFNPAAEEAFGYAKEEVLGRPVDLLYADPGEGSHAHVGTLKEGQFKGEITNRRKNGETFYSYLSAAVMRDAEGEVVGVMGISRDITQRKRAEAALQKVHQELEQRVEERTAALRTINESLQQEIIHRKHADEILTGQREILEMVASGRPLQETLDALNTMIEKLAPETLCSVLLLDEAGQHLFHGSAPSLPEEYIRAINGIAIGPFAGSCGTAAYRNETIIVEDTEIDPLWAEYRPLARAYGLRACWSVPIRDSSGAVLGTFALYDRRPRQPSDQDVRLVAAAAHLAGIAIERKRAEEALRESEEQYRALYEDNPSMYFTVDPQGTVLSVNPFGAEQLGYTVDELVGQSILNVFDKEDTESVLRQLTSCVQNPTQVAHWEFRKVCKDGSRLWVREAARAIRGTQGETVVLIVCEDITERKRVEEALRESKRRLEQQNRALVELTKTGTVGRGDLEVALKVVTEAAAKTLQVERVGVWLYNDDRSMIRCIEQYELSVRKHTKGAELAAADYPSYFQTLEENRAIDAHDAHTDPRTSEFSERYLSPHGITSMLDAPIRVGGEMVGIVCHEHVGARRRWILEEQSFAGSIADVVGLALETHERQRAEEALQRLSRQSELILTSAGEGIYGLDIEGKATFVNQAAARMIGWEVQELMGQPMHAILHHSKADGTPYPAGECPIYAAFKDGAVHHVDNEVFWRKEGTSFPVEYTSTPIWEDGQPVGAVVTFKDITERKGAEAALRDSEERYRALYEDNPAMYFTVDPRGTVLSVNQFGAEQLGYTVDELVGESVLDVFFEEDREAGLQQLSACLHNPGRVIHGEFRKIRKDGSRVWVREVVRAVHGTDDNIVVLIVCEDITERKRAEEQLLHDAFHDRLTGLPNRALFMDQLGRSLRHTKRREDYLIAVLLLDLDHFKIINDSLGHLIGDHLLIAIARRLENSLRGTDMVARLGGDEFAILLEDIKDISEATFVTDRIQRTLTLPFNLDGHEVFTTASIGIALSVTGYGRPEDLLRNADTAMYRAKAHGRARHEVFDTAMHDRAVARLQLETDLRRAIERKELQLHYQPIVLLETGKIVGFETLVRWQHPQRGFVAPAEFIPVAEETGLIIPINRWLLREACRQMRTWQSQFPVSPPLTISMNLSGKQFTQSDLIEQIDQILKETGLEASSLKLEITESAIIEYAEAATVMINQLRSRGIHLCLDDFGTGYSSLSYLHHFPIEMLKIDRSFVKQMDGGGDHIEIVRAIVMLAHNLGIAVVAEGVETTEQLAQLRALQCTYGQGYLFSEPVDSEAVDILMERHGGCIWGEPTAGAGLWGVGVTEGR